MSRVVALAAALLALFATASAASNGRSAGPFQVSAATLAQKGQQLIWDVQLDKPWAARRLAGQGRSLCLLIERVASGVVWGKVCVAGPTRGLAEPRLEYSPVNGTNVGPVRVITASVTRPSSSGLTASFLPSAVDLRYGPIRWQTVSTLSGSGCASGAPGPVAPRSGAPGSCSVLFPAKPTVLKLHTPVLVGCVPTGPSLVYRGPSTRREIALTFDDGPWSDPPTAQFLQVLEREHVPATFFEIGDQISSYDPGGKLERRMLADGDMIGDHTWNHPANLVSLRPAMQRQELVRTAAAIRGATGRFTPCIWRPPYGATSRSLVSLARSLGFLTILWDIDPRDWSLPGVGALYSNVVSNAHNGAIVLQHFGGGPRFQTLAALPQEIETLRARGYRFVTVTQLLGLQLVYR